MGGQGARGAFVPLFDGGIRLEALQQEGGALARHHLRDVGLVRAFVLPDLFLSPLLGDIAILRRHRRGIDEFLRNSGSRQKQRDKR